MKTVLVLILYCMPLYLLAGDTTWEIHGVADVYIQHELNNNNTGKRALAYAYSESGQFALNLGAIQVKRHDGHTRGSVALAAGSYMRFNYASEPREFRNILEANAGFRIGKVWIDAGIIPSHLGTESAISTNCRTLTRSLAAENSPYFETGVKATYELSDQWYFSGLILNGWQNIQDNNQAKAYGTQIQFKPSDKVVFNWGSFVGDEQINTSNTRIFNDIYMIWTIRQGLELKLLLNAGHEEDGKQVKGYNHWYASVLQVHKQFNDFHLTLRAEAFEDPWQVILPSPVRKGLTLYGGSLNADYHITDQFVVRAEFRSISSSEKVFPEAGGFTEINNFITAALISYF